MTHLILCEDILKQPENSCQNENYIADSPQLLISLLFDFSESVDKLTPSKIVRFPDKLHVPCVRGLIELIIIYDPYRPSRSTKHYYCLENKTR